MKSLLRAPNRPVVVFAFLGGVLIAGCTQTATGDPVRSVSPVSSVAPTAVTSPSTSEQVAPPTTTAPTATTSPASSAPTTPTPSAPASTAPVYQTELVLRRTGIGAMDFGAPADEVITYVGSLFGSSTEDSDWVEATEFPDCPGKMVRVVEWGALSLQFSDDSTYGQGDRHFSGWVYGSIDEIGAPPEGMVTELGLTTGSSVLDLKDRYPEVQIEEGDPNSAFPDSFFVGDDLTGLLTGTGDDDLVTVLYGGAGCGH